MDLKSMLTTAHERRASDLHLTVGRPPTLRITGALFKMPLPILKPEDTERLAGEVMPPLQRQMFEQRGEIDVSYSVTGLGRYRVNVYRQRGSIGIAMRVIPEEIPSFDALNIPAVVRGLTEKVDGLIIVTGPTGHGKSTTLAAMVDRINATRGVHIVTLEDPIEYLHRHNLSMVNQREVFVDTQSFVAGLRSALREDPDVIMVGEMRDLETIATAISAAETGHLVLATLHTPSASQTIDRIVDVFPPHQQPQIRIQLSMVLEAVVAQRLLPKIDGSSLVLATEILVATPAIRNLIREGKTHQIDSLIQTGKKHGMHTMESDLRRLYETGVIGSDQYNLYTRETTTDVMNRQSVGM